MRIFPLTLLMFILYFSLSNSSHAFQLSPKGIFVEKLFVDGISVSDSLSKLEAGVPNPVFELSIIKQDSLTYILQWKANSTCNFFEIEITNVDSAETFMVKTTAHSYVVSHLIGHYSFKVSACLLHCSEPIALLHTFSTEYYSLDFTGSFVLQTQSTSEIDFGQEFTIEMLLFPRDDPYCTTHDCAPCPFSYATRTRPNEMTIFFSGSTSTLLFYVTDQSFTSDIILPLDEWAHLMVMVSNSASAGTTAITIFVNGIQVSTLSKEYKDQVAPGGCVSIGNDQDTYGGAYENRNQFRGIIDEVRIWSSTFTERQAFQMFNHRADARFLSTGYLGAIQIGMSALVAQWSFTGSTVEDMGKDEPKGLYALERGYSETGSSMATLGSATEGWLAANRVIRFSTPNDVLRSKGTVPIPTRGLTLSFWMKVDTPSMDATIAVVGFASELSDNTLTIWIRASRIMVYRMSTFQFTTTSAVEPGVWTHWAFTEEFFPDKTAMLSLYRNGQLFHSLPTTRFFPPRDNYVAFGQDFDCLPTSLNPGCWQAVQALGTLNASLDNVHIYSRPLAAEEMAQEPYRCALYSSAAEDPDLAASFSFDQTSLEPTSTDVFDESGASTHLVVSSTNMFALETGVPVGSCRAEAL